MKRKSFVLALTAAMMAAALVVGGTLAYFTDTTDTKVNAFTVGDVDITLEEPKWEEKDYDTNPPVLNPGTAYDKDPTITVETGSQDSWVFLQVDMNKYVSLINLMGVDAYKNSIAGLTGEYPGFIQFVTDMINNHEMKNEVLGRWFQGIDHSAWEVMNLTELKAAVEGAATGTNPTALTIILGYKEIQKAGNEIIFMDRFGMPVTITQSMMDGDDAYIYNGKSASNFNTDSSTFKMKFTAYAIQAAELDTLGEAYTALFG